MNCSHFSLHFASFSSPESVGLSLRRLQSIFSPYFPSTIKTTRATTTTPQTLPPPTQPHYPAPLPPEQHQHHILTIQPSNIITTGTNTTTINIINIHPATQIIQWQFRTTVIERIGKEEEEEQEEEEEEEEAELWYRLAVVIETREERLGREGGGVVLISRALLTLAALVIGLQGTGVLEVGMLYRREGTDRRLTAPFAEDRGTLWNRTLGPSDDYFPIC
ncbi:hypothetical protein ACOMHN_027844 [Nucella lapillus]